MAETRSTCPYCGVGCGVVIDSDAGRIIGVRGDPEHPANFGRLCSKGQTLHLTAAPSVTMQVRALQPMRRASRNAALRPVVWDAALDEVAERFAAVIESDGPDAVGLYLSGQLLTEDYYAFNKLAKGLIHTNNVDTNSRLCMSSAVAGYKASLGSDAVPACYDDIARAKTVFITGSNMAWAHPVLYRRLEDARRADPLMKVIVVDPRRTETAAEADLHLQLLPGTDVVLHHAMLHLMLWEGLVDHVYIQAHTSGFDALRDRVREFSPAHAAKVCGLKEGDIVQAARWFAANAPTLSLWCMGLNQSSSGTDKNTTLLNLHLATGQIGKPGAGPLSLTGQPNAMGGREVGGLANLLSAHRDLANPAHRAEVAALWGVSDVPASPGKAAVQMFQAAADGQIKALWIACTNPAQSMPDQALVRRALQRCEFVVVQEAYTTAATVDFADVLLPATSWGEKEGTVTNSERRISRVRAAAPPPGLARADWQIAAEVAQRLERRLPSRRLPGRGASMFGWPDAEAVWNEHRESTRGRDLDITGLSWDDLAQPRQWPFAVGATTGEARLFGDGRFNTSDGRARFHAPAWRPTAEQRDAHFPVSLTTGRWRDQWHGMTRTGTLARLQDHGGEPVVEMHPQELMRRRLNAGDLVQLRSRRGAIVLPVRASDTVLPAQAFVAMHAPEVNRLMGSARCPESGQPELKHAAIRVDAAALPWSLAAAAWLPADQALAVQQRMLPLMAACRYAHIRPIGRIGSQPAGPLGLVLRLAHSDAALAPEAVAEALGLADGSVLRYDDPKHGIQRRVQVGADGRLHGFLFAGDTASAGWMLDWLQQGQPVGGLSRALLAGGALPPVARPSAGRAVCTCHGVGETAIAEVLRAAPEGSEAARLAHLQAALACGTSCGSCLPTLKALVRQIQPVVLA
jgi:assimilatory nitrate reductase catalytic subunit